MYAGGGWVGMLGYHRESRIIARQQAEEMKEERRGRATHARRVDLNPDPGRASFEIPNLLAEVEDHLGHAGEFGAGGGGDSWSKRRRAKKRAEETDEREGRRALKQAGDGRTDQERLVRVKVLLQDGLDGGEVVRKRVGRVAVGVERAEGG